MVKRGVVDTLLRSFDNTVANWQVILLRLGEAVLIGVTSIVSALVILAPLVVSLGIRLKEIDSPDKALEAIVTLLEGWTMLLWIFLAVSVLLLVFVAVHSFVTAACARIAVDADRAAGPATKGPRSRFRAFSMSRWLAGGVEGWWSIFWIYNVAWSLAGAILLIPLLPTALMVNAMADENPEAAMVVGVSGLVLTLLLGIAISIVASIWTNRAIAGWPVRREPARAALRTAWRALRGDVARHVLIALAIFVVAGAGSSFFASFSMFSALSEAMGRSSIVHAFTIPVRVFGWVLSSVFSSAIATWFLCAYSALAVEDVRAQS